MAHRPLHAVEHAVESGARDKHRADRHEPAGQRLGQTDQVRLEPPVLQRQEATGAPNAGLHLIAHQQRARVAAQPLRGRQIAVGGQVDALALHRLDDERRHVATCQLALQGVDVAERDGLAAGQQRPEALAELVVAVERERTEREPMEGVLGKQDRARPVAARAILIAASTASVPLLAGTIAATEPGARASSCSASTPLSSVTPSWGRLAVCASIVSRTAAIASGWLRPIANTP